MATEGSRQAAPPAEKERCGPSQIATDACFEAQQLLVNARIIVTALTHLGVEIQSAGDTHRLKAQSFGERLEALTMVATDQIERALNAVEVPLNAEMAGGAA